MFVAITLLFVLYAMVNRIHQQQLGDAVRVYGSFWEAGAAAAAGRNPYAIYPMVLSYAGIEPGIPEINLNPPALLPLFQIMALADPHLGRLAWLFIAGAAYWFGAWILFKRTRADLLQIPWLLLSPAVSEDLAHGQIYSLLFVLGILTWLSLREGRPHAAALAMGVLIAIKPNFAVWCALVLCAGYPGVAFTAGITALCLSVLPALAYGSELYGQWFAAVAQDRHYLLPTDLSLHGLGMRMGAALAGYAAALTLLAWLALWAWRTRPSLYDLTAVALLAAILCSPIAWFHYMLVLVPFIVDRPWRAPMLAAVVLTFPERLWGFCADRQGLTLLIVSLAAMAPALIMLPVFVARAGRRSASLAPSPTLGLNPCASIQPASSPNRSPASAPPRPKA